MAKLHKTVSLIYENSYWKYLLTLPFPDIMKKVVKYSSMCSLISNSLEFHNRKFKILSPMEKMNI